MTSSTNESASAPPAPLPDAAAPPAAPSPEAVFRGEVLKSVVALVAGIGVGHVMGARAELLTPVSTMFVSFLKMLFLPFVMLSLISSLGRLAPSLQRRLAGAGLLWMTVLIAVSLAVAFAVAQSFPRVGNATFHQSSREVDAPEPDALEQLVPSNVFRAMANGGVPGIVFFCVLVAWKLAGTPRREVLLDAVGVGRDVFRALAADVKRIWPVAVFFIGITDFSHFGATIAASGLVPFFIAMLAYSALLLLAVFPSALSLMTPVGYVRAMQATIPAFLLAFVTGSIFPAIPTATQAAATLIAAGGDDSGKGVEDSEAEAAAILPISFCAPSAGSVLGILFVLYAATVYDRALSLYDVFHLCTVEVVVLLNSPVAAARHALSYLQVPVHAVDLLTDSNGLFERFRSGVTVASLIVLTVLTHYTVHQDRRPPLMRLGALCAAFLVPVALLAHLWGARTVASALAPSDYYEQTTVSLPSGVTVVRDDEVAPERTPLSGMERLRRGQPLRVGVQLDRLPFAYRARSGALGGYAVALAALLAEDLHAKVQIVLTVPERFESDLAEGRIDLMLSPIVMDGERLLTFDFGPEFGRVRPSIVAPDLRTDQIRARLASKDWSGLRVAVWKGSKLEQRAPGLLAGADIVTVERPDEVLTRTDCDALLWTDLEGESWEVSHPTWTSVALENAPPFVLAYPVRLGDHETRLFLEKWMGLQRSLGRLDALYARWVHGRPGEIAVP